MKTRIIFPIFCIYILLLTSCSKIHCPGFPEHLSDYFPYRRGDTLSFINQNYDTLSFRIEIIEMTQEWSYGWNCKCFCVPPSLFFYLHQVTDPRWTGMYLKIEAGNKYNKPCIQFELGDGYFDGETLTSSFLDLYDETGKNPFDPQNNALFGDTTILKPHFKDQKICSVTIVFGMGITDFYDQKHVFQWEIIKK